MKTGNLKTSKPKTLISISLLGIMVLSYCYFFLWGEFIVLYNFSIDQDKTADILSDQIALDYWQNNYWDHTLSDGCSFQCRLKKANKNRDSFWAENLYLGKCDISYANELFSKSPSHKANIDLDLSAEYINIYPKGNQCLMVFLYTDNK